MFCPELSDRQIARYEAIFAAGDGEALLGAWEDTRASGRSMAVRFRLMGSAAAFEPEWLAGLKQAADAAGSPLEIAHLSHAISEGYTEFARACLRVLPDRFFDLRQPVACRDQHQFQNDIFVRLLAYAGDIEMSAQYQELVEVMVKRGWDPLHGTRIPKVQGPTPGMPPQGEVFNSEWSLTPVLYELAGRDGSTPLLRRLLPYIGGARGMRGYSDSFCNGLAREERACTLLHRAAQAQDVEMIRFLVNEVGVDPNTPDPMGATVLGPALGILSGGNVAAAQETVRELISLGLDVERRNERGETALVTLIGHGQEEAAKFLLDLGADATVRDRGGATLLQLAGDRGLDGIARILRSRDMRRILDAAMPDEDWPVAAKTSGGLTL